MFLGVGEEKKLIYTFIKNKIPGEFLKEYISDILGLKAFIRKKSKKIGSFHTLIMKKEIFYMIY